MAARVRHWATAGTVLIEGATGSSAGVVNGRFKVAERPDNEPPIYRKADGSDWWLYVSRRGTWVVGDTRNKDERRSLMSAAFSSEAADGRLPHEVGRVWKVCDGGKWNQTPPPYTDQQLRVHDEVCACMRACTHACTCPHSHAHTHTRTHAYMHT